MQKLKFAGITVVFTMAAAAFFTLTDVQNVMADEILMPAWIRTFIKQMYEL